MNEQNVMSSMKSS